MRLYFSLDKKEREGFTTYDPESSEWFENADVEEIAGEAILEKVKDIIYFIEMCSAVLKPGATATFTAPYFASWQAWSDPRNIRGISQGSLNFADKNWREQNNCPDLCKADFEVGCNMAIDATAANGRSEATKEFWINRYNNVVQSLLFTLKKK